jgi:hypothetical protein
MMSASVNPSSSSWYLLFHSAPARLRRPLVSRLDGTAFRWHFALGLLLFFFFFCLNPHGVHIPPPVVSRVFVFSLFYFRLGLANGLEIATSYIMSFLIVLAFLIATAMSLQHLVMCRSG